jgi:hypothetical protein
VWNHQGQLVNGWPRWIMDSSNWGSPILHDLDLDGDLEVLLWAAGGGRLFAFRANGTELLDGDQNPSTIGIMAPRIFDTSFNYGSPAIAQLDQDALPEIVVPVNLSGNDSGGIYAFNSNGTQVPGWPYFTGEPDHPSDVSASPAIGDLDNDGDHEVVIACERDTGQLLVLQRNGTLFPGWPRPVGAYTPDARLPSPVVGDLDEDGFLDVIYAATDGRLWAFNRNGTALPGFPVTYYPAPPVQATQSTPTLGDIDNDGRLEIVFGDESGKVHAYNHDGTLAAGFPIQTNGEVRASPTLWDLDRDNLVEVVVVSYDANVYVYDVAGDFNPTRLPWPSFRHDTQNTGRSGQDPIGIGDPGPAPALTAALHRARPNPFNPRVALAFDVPGQSGGARPVRLEVYDVQGRLVSRLVDGPVETGRHTVEWDGRSGDGRALASGVYVARIAIGDFTATQKLTLVR